MWYPAVTVGVPSGDVLDLERVKLFLRVDGNSEDDTVADAVASAAGHVEAYTGTRLLAQQVELRAGSFADLAHLPIGPVTGLLQVSYLDPAGAGQVLDPAVYELFGAGLERGIRTSVGRFWPAVRAVDDAVTVRLEVGYGGPTDVPAPVQRAILLLAGDFYEQRADSVAERGVTPATLPNGVDAMLANYRIYG